MQFIPVANAYHKVIAKYTAAGGSTGGAVPTGLSEIYGVTVLDSDGSTAVTYTVSSGTVTVAVTSNHTAYIVVEGRL
jgi:hypothetical protein